MKFPAYTKEIIILIWVIIAIIIISLFVYKPRLSDWKNYVNDEFGFQFKYPPEWEIRFAGHNPPNEEFLVELGTSNFIKHAVIDGTTIEGPCSINIDFDPRIRSGLNYGTIMQFNDYVTFVSQYHSSSTMQQINLNGIDGIKVGDTYFLPYKNDAIMIQFEFGGGEKRSGKLTSYGLKIQDECRLAFENIISTFILSNK